MRRNEYHNTQFAKYNIARHYSYRTDPCGVIDTGDHCCEITVNTSARIVKRRIIAGVERSKATDFFETFEVPDCTIVYNSIARSCINGVAYIVADSWTISFC